MDGSECRNLAAARLREWRDSTNGMDGKLGWMLPVSMIHSAGVGRMLDFGRCLPAARLHDTFYLSQEHPRIIMGLKSLDCIPHPHASPASETGT